MLLIGRSNSLFYSLLFFFKQKTAYEMRMSDWSSDVCSSDLFRTIGADDVAAAVDHHLRRVDVAQAELGNIVALALGVLCGGEGILPADVVPVVDVERQRQHARLVGQLSEQRIGRRTGAAALRGEQLDHYWASLAGFGAQRQHCRSEERRGGKEWGSTCRSRWSPYH